MIRLVMKNKLYSFERIIFPNCLEKSACDIIRYMRFYDLPASVDANRCDTYRSPITDLTLSIDDIKAGYSKEVRYEVGRASRESIQYLVYDSLSLTNDYQFIKDIEGKYYSFCDQIGEIKLKHNLIPEEFEHMIDNGNIIVSKAEFDNGWTHHIYQVDGSNALLWFSFSDYRKENANKSMAGWANRGLHDYDIQYFKGKGYVIYDWGNIADENNPNHIDKFKMSFGGNLKTVYCWFAGNTYKGKFLVWARYLKSRLVK